MVAGGGGGLSQEEAPGCEVKADRMRTTPGGMSSEMTLGHGRRQLLSLLAITERRPARGRAPIMVL